MAKDLSAVGAAATASKSDTGLNGDDVFDNQLSITKADNGGFSMSVSYKRKKQGDRRGQSISDYCPPKTEVFANLDSALDRARALFGGGAAEPDADTDDSDGAPPAPTSSSGY